MRGGNKVKKLGEKSGRPSTRIGQVHTVFMDD